MPNLIFKNEYVIVSQIFKESQKHFHPMLQIFIGNENNKVIVEGKEYAGKVIIINQNVNHYIETRENCQAFILLQPSSVMAKKIKEDYLKNQEAIVLKEITFEKILLQDSGQELEKKVERILNALQINREQGPLDTRIATLIMAIHEGKYFNASIKEIAKAYRLSESRIAHLFKEEIGLSIMSYIQLVQLEYVYRKVLAGENITNVALEAGFNSSSHFAYVCKKITGISISKVMKIAGF